jgi:hypothetical protein
MPTLERQLLRLLRLPFRHSSKMFSAEGGGHAPQTRGSALFSRQAWSCDQFTFRMVRHQSRIQNRESTQRELPPLVRARSLQRYPCGHTEAFVHVQLSLIQLPRSKRGSRFGRKAARALRSVAVRVCGATTGVPDPS